MAESNVSGLAGTKGAGLAIMAGFVLTLIASFFAPGSMLIDPVDQTDFAKTIDVMANHASLAHAMTFLVIVAMFLYAYGVLPLFRLPNRQGGFASPALRFGLIASLFGWGIFIIAAGKRHMIVHLMQRSMQAEAAPEMQAEFQNLAVATYADMAGIVLAFLTVYPIASMLIGLALAARFRGMNVYRLAAYGLVVIGVAGLVNFLVVQHAPGVDISVLLPLHNTLLLIGGVCLYLIGLGMYLERSELMPEGSSS